MIPEMVIALTLVAENGQSLKGMENVYTVISNRGKGNIEQMAKECLKLHQLTCWSNKPLMARAKIHPRLKDAFRIIQENRINSKLSGCKHYMTHRLYYGVHRPKWAEGHKVVYNEGLMGHVFLIEK